jgi:hypothetical protein
VDDARRFSPMKALAPGDIVITPAVDRLSRDTQREAIKRRDVDGETLRSIARSYNVSPQTISRLTV